MEGKMRLFKENESVIIFKSNKSDLNLEEFLYSMNISGRLFRRLYKKKHIFTNGIFIRKSIKLKKGDIISLYLEDEIENIVPEPIEINIIYEDMDLLILNKEPNIVVHPTKSHQSSTLSNGIANYFLENQIYKKIRFVNRLDMDTTGILMVAKNSFAHQLIEPILTTSNHNDASNPELNRLVYYHGNAGCKYWFYYRSITCHCLSITSTARVSIRFFIYFYYRCLDSRIKGY